MAEQADAPEVVEVEIPLPVGDEPKPDWRNPPVLSFGHRLLNEIDPNRDVLFPHQQRQILAISSEEQLHAMLYKDLGDTLEPDLVKAKELFGDMLTRELEIPKLIMTWRFYTIAQCMLCIDDGRKISFDKSFSNPERINAHKATVEAVKALNQMVDRVQQLAKATGALKVIRNRKLKSDAAPKVLRAPPRLAQ